MGLLMLSSCTFNEPLAFTTLGKTQKDYKECASQHCPVIQVNYLQAITDDDKATLINQQIQDKIISKIIDVNEQANEVQHIDQAIAIFISDFKKYERDLGNAFMLYELETSMSILLHTESVVSMELNYYIFTGGAHGYNGTLFLNFDAKTGKMLQHKELFSNFEDVLAYAEKEFRSVYEIAPDSSISAHGFWFENNQFHLPKNVGFTKNAMLLQYNPYEIASYAEGAITLKIPIEEITPFLKFQAL